MAAVSEIRNRKKINLINETGVKLQAANTLWLDRRCGAPSFQISVCAPHDGNHIDLRVFGQLQNHCSSSGITEGNRKPLTRLNPGFLDQVPGGDRIYELSGFLGRIGTPTDFGRAVAYRSSSDRETGRLAGWCQRFVYVQFDARPWTNYPRCAGFICVSVFPGHLAFERSENSTGKKMRT